MIRNALCVRYEKCLDLAAKRDGGFDCRRCRLRSSHLYPTIPDEGAIVLLWAIFKPERWEAFNQLRKGGDEGGDAATAEGADNDAGDCMDYDGIV
jgi:hypothetical protein